MTNASPDLWQPSKYVASGDGWHGSRDRGQVSAGSRLICDILAPQYAEMIDLHATGDLLDHGCGQSPLRGMYGPKAASVTTIDWSNSLHKPAHIDIACDLNGPMPIDDASFDTVMSSDVIEHLWNPLAVFAEIARVLRPGGKLIVGTPFNYQLHEQPHDYFRWSPHAITKVGEEAGLHVLTLRKCGGQREVLADTMLKLCQSSFGVRPTIILDKLLRATRFVSVTKSRDQAMMLGVVAVLQKPLD